MVIFNNNYLLWLFLVLQRMNVVWGESTSCSFLCSSGALLRKALEWMEMPESIFRVICKKDEYRATWVEELFNFVFLRSALLRKAFWSNDGSLPETLDFHGLSMSRLRRWVIFRQEWSLQVFNRSVQSCTLDALVHKGFVSRIMLHQFLALLLLQFWNFGMTSVYTQIPFI